MHSIITGSHNNIEFKLNNIRKIMIDHIRRRGYMNEGSVIGNTKYEIEKSYTSENSPTKRISKDS